MSFPPAHRQAFIYLAPQRHAGNTPVYSRQVKQAIQHRVAYSIALGGQAGKTRATHKTLLPWSLGEEERRGSLALSPAVYGPDSDSHLHRGHGAYPVRERATPLACSPMRTHFPQRRALPRGLKGSHPCEGRGERPPALTTSASRSTPWDWERNRDCPPGARSGAADAATPLRSRLPRAGLA